jgi:outer membrane protein insertion porin family
MGAWVAIVLAAAAPEGAAPAAPESDDAVPTELRTVAEVDLVGRHQVPAKEIWAVLKTKRPSWMPWRERTRVRMDFLRADTAAIAAVAREYGFLDARVTWELRPARAKNLTEVRFLIHEGRQYRIRNVQWDGVVSVPLEPLRRRVYSRPGRPFNPAYLVADTVRIARYYQEKGYLPRVAASFTRDTLLHVDVRYAVSEGPTFTFGKVYLSSPGEVHVSEHLIRRELLIQQPEPFNMTRVERSIERLYETGLFSQAQISLLPDTAKRVVEFDLRVRERKRRWIDAGVGSGTSERFRFTGEWGNRNLTNHGQQGVISSRLAFNGDSPPKFLLTHTEVSLLEPWLIRTRTRGQLTGYYEERDDRAVPQWVISQVARGFSVQLRRELTRHTLVSLTQDNTFVTQAVTFLTDSIPLARRDSLKTETPDRYTTHRILLNFERDARDNPLNPVRGSYQSVIGEVAGGPLKGTSSFSKLQGQGAVYLPTARGWVVAARARGGVIDPFGTDRNFSPDPALDRRVARVPLEDRFRIGGVNSVRGYSENSIPGSGGLALMQANLEVRVPLIGPFGFEVFADGGNVWRRPSRIRISQFRPRLSHQTLGDDDVRYVIGVGPRLNLPIGPLRLDFTWSLRPSGTAPALRAAPQFAIGPTF